MAQIMMEFGYVSAQQIADAMPAEDPSDTPSSRRPANERGA
jgi:hypothetical protein